MATSKVSETPTATIWARVRCTLGPSGGKERMAEYQIARGSRVEVGAGMAIYPGDLIIFEIRVNAGMTMEKAHLFYQQRFKTFE